METFEPKRVLIGLIDLETREVIGDTESLTYQDYIKNVSKDMYTPIKDHDNPHKWTQWEVIDVSYLDGEK